MSAIPLSVAERLGKLISRLGSDHDGEILAAAGLIQKTLQSADRDLNDLAEHVRAPARTIVPYYEHPADRPVGPRNYGNWHPTPNLHHKETIARCQRLDFGRLSAWEKLFLANTSTQLNQGRQLTGKQAGVLSNIVAKLEGRSS